MQKFVFQLISHETGHRSEAFIGTWDDVAKSIEENEQTDSDDFLLVVATVNPEDENDFAIPQIPLIKISTFAKTHNQKLETA